MYYMGLNENNKPSGWSREPWGNSIQVDDSVYQTASLNPDYIWDGTALVAPPAPVPYIPPPVTSITMRQARLILLQYGLLDTVDATVKGIGGAAAIEWEYAGTVDRTNPLVAMVAAGAGMTEAQIDTMFTEGSVL